MGRVCSVCLHVEREAIDKQLVAGLSYRNFSRNLPLRGGNVGRVCSVCLHAEREAIDKQLVAGLSYRNLAARYGLSSQALIRHRNEHLPETLVRAYEASEAARATTSSPNSPSCAPTPAVSG